MFLKVVAHIGNLLGANTGGLNDLGVAGGLVLLVEGNNQSGIGLGESSTTAATLGENHDTCGIVLGNEHVLLVTHTDTSLGWVPVSISGKEGALELIDLDGLGIGGAHALNKDALGEQLGESGRPGPCRTVLTIDGDSLASTSVNGSHRVPVVFVENLLDISHPSIFCHLLWYSIFN